jgi:hypothetical protein
MTEVLAPILKMAEIYGVPEYFATDVGLIESAGGGNMRIVRCIKRGGILYPVFSLVTPTISMIRALPPVQQAAIKLHNFEPTH